MHGLAMLAEQGNALSIDASAVVIFGTAVVLVWVLNRLLFKPINDVLDERDRRTRGFHSEARAMLAESDRKLARYEAAMRQARADMYQLLEQRRKEALARRARRLEAAKQDLANHIADARRQVQAQVAAAKPELMADAQIIAHRIAASLAGRHIEGVRGAS